MAEASDAVSRRALLRGGVGVAAASALMHGIAAQAAPTSAAPRGANAFDFLLGSWSVRHRKLKQRLAGSIEWIEFPGELTVRPFDGGLGNIDENVLYDPNGQYVATSLRLFDPANARWSVYWIDGRAPSLDQPVVGHAEGNKIALFNEEIFEGRKIRVRAMYENLASGRARWSQAFSTDGGSSWEINWWMDFSR